MGTKVSLWFFLEDLKRLFWCRWRHRRHRCTPGFGEGKSWHCFWHCDACHPCNEIFDMIEGKRIRGWLWDQKVCVEKLK